MSIRRMLGLEGRSRIIVVVATRHRLVLEALARAGEDLPLERREAVTTAGLAGCAGKTTLALSLARYFHQRAEVPTAVIELCHVPPGAPLRLLPYTASVTPFSYGPSESGDWYFGVDVSGTWYARVDVDGVLSNQVSWDVHWYPVHVIR